MDKLTVYRYARALFRSAYEKDGVDDYFNQINSIYEQMVWDAAFMDIIRHPDILLDEKCIVVENAFKNKVFDDILGFFYVILRKNREEDILSIIHVFISMVWEHKGMLCAAV